LREINLGNNTKKNKLSISVISIGRNCIDSIDDTYYSVMSQEFSSFEYIIIDGASTDGSVDHIKLISGFDSKIILLSEPDTGISNAMNKGVKIANGHLIIHLHFGDKFVNNNILAQVWNSYLTHGWDWASGNLKITKNGNDIDNFLFLPSSASNLRRKNCVPHQSTFISISEFNAAGGFDESLNQAMDYDLWLRLHYVRKLELFNLNMNIASFDSTGESSKIFHLLKGSYLVRRKLKEIYCINFGIIEDIVFLSRIFAYWFYYKIKSNLIN
jgi:glycosyltransferase involved in cell wall biosynthesis